MKFEISITPKNIDKKLEGLIDKELEKGAREIEVVMNKAKGIADRVYLAGGSNAVLHKITSKLSGALRVVPEGNSIAYGVEWIKYGKYHEQINNKYPRMYKANKMPKRPFLIPSLRDALMGLKPDTQWREARKKKLMEVLKR